MRLIAITGLAFAGVLLASPDARAAAPDDGFHSAGVVYVAPAGVYLPVGDADTRDAFDPGYQWGLGGGYMWRRNHFMLSLGGAFEHLVANFDGCGRDDCRGGMVRLSPELRIGGGTRRFFGYGRAAPGLAYSFAAVDFGGLEADDNDLGFNLGLGAGFQAIVWSNLAVGAELNADFALFADDHIVDDIHTVAFRAMVLWYF